MNALFLKLLNMSAAGSVLILAVVALRALLKRAPRWILCALWALVAVRLVCPLSIVSPLSVFQAAPSVVSDSGEVEVFRSTGGSEKPLLAVDTLQIERPRVSSETIQSIPGTSLAVTQRSRDAYLPPLVQGYLLGLAGMILYAIISTLLLRKKVSASLRQRGNICVCDAVASPFILGIIRPTVYLPSAISEEEKRYVLAHERAHMRRLDHIWKPMGFLVLSVHWFNPFCWLGYVLLCRDIELACDEKVIRELGKAERAAYSQTLLNCSAHRVLAACPVAFGETDVKRRVKAVLNYRKPAFWVLLAAVLGCIVLIVCFAADPLPKEPDLSFLNYKNAIPLIGMNYTAPYVNLFPADSNGVQPGVADSKALAQFLESARWAERRAPSPSPEPRGCIEFIIEDEYRILVYQSQPLAAVRSGNDIRYYRINDGDYEAALNTFIPAPSTEPEIIGSYDRSYWEEVERELASFAHSGRTEVSLDASFDSAIPADAALGPLTLEDYIYGSDGWTFEYNGSAIINDPEAMVIIRDSDGRSLWIMSDAEALMIEEADGSITWARCGNAPMDCGDMIRHLLPWAGGEESSTEDELAESAAAAHRVYAQLGHYTLAGMEPLQERTDSAPPFWAALQSRAPAACFAATAYFGTEEMSADLRYERVYWNGDSPRSIGSEGYSLCRSFYAASTALTDVKISEHDGFLTDISGFAGRRLIWYDEERDLLFSLVASHVKNGQGAGTFSASELIAMAENVAPSGKFDLWIQQPSVSPVEVVQSAIENQRKKEYTLAVQFGEAIVDDGATERAIRMYRSSDLAHVNGWSGDYLENNMIVVHAKYSVEYDHEKTFLPDGEIEQFFILLRDERTQLWSIWDNTTNGDPFFP